MELFEALLAQEQVSIERFVRFRIDSPADAEDILQETYLTAYQKFSQLRNPDAFKAWVLSIARNKCTDYFRQKALRQETSFEALAESADSRYGASDSASVRETFDTLREKDRQPRPTAECTSPSPLTASPCVSAAITTLRPSMPLPTPSTTASPARRNA